MSRALDDLHPDLRPKAFELIARCAEAGIAVMVIDTLRTEAEQALYLKKGVSWTKNSRHLTGHAIDICPYELYTAAPRGDKLMWDAASSLWPKIGAIGESLGLIWGGRWDQADLGHFEYREASPKTQRA